jgi:DNA-binding transcriptional MerR regulator
MNNILTTATESLENFNAFIRRTTLIKIVYLLFAVIVGTKFFPLPLILFIAIFLMIIYPLIISLFAHRYFVKTESIINATFLLALLDIFFITIIINFLGIMLYIIYSFYIVLAFMALPRYKAIYVTAWIVVLYSGLVLLQYFQISKPLQLFAGQKITPQNLNFVLPASAIYLITLFFLSVRCYDFYKVIARKINDLQKTYSFLEEEKKLLGEKVKARKIELENEKSGLEKKIENRKEELVKENKELEEKIIELEEFKKVTTGREEKIEELKKELENLRRKGKLK